MVSAKEMPTCDICARLQELQHICENGSGAMLTTVVEVIEIASDRVEWKRRNTTLSR